MPLPIMALVLATLLAAFACSEKNSGQPTSDVSTTAPDAQCTDYCEALEQADCTGAMTGDCTDTCTATIDSLGSCVESWRTVTQCLIEVGFTRTDTGAVVSAGTDLREPPRFGLGYVHASTLVLFRVRAAAVGIEKSRAIAGVGRARQSARVGARVRAATGSGADGGVAPCSSLRRAP